MLNKQRLTFAVFITVLVVFQGGCGQNEPDEEVQPQEQNGIAGITINKSDSSTLINDTAQTEDSLDQTPPETEATKTSTKESIKSSSGNVISDDIAKNDVVENLGFSEATDSFKISQEETSSLYCLDPDKINNIDSVTKLCKKMSDRLASVDFKQCVGLDLQMTGCRSVKGTPILIREFPPLKGRKPLGRILVIGGTHGDELTSVSVTVRWIEQLARNHSGLFHWHMTPLMNPDGVLKPGATRTNNNGVDLNRNMPSEDWNEKALLYWRDKSAKDKRKFPGNMPASEPETQWLIDEIKHFQPDAIISVHAPYGVVDFDSLLLNKAPKSLGKLHLNLLGTYPGSLGNYAGINRNIPVITLELPHSWEMPSVHDSNRIWDDIVKWLKLNIKPEKN